MSIELIHYKVREEILKKVDVFSGKNKEDLFWKECKEKDTIESYTEYINKYPNGIYIAYAYNQRGIYFALEMQDDKAIADFTDSLRIEPNAVVYANRANLYKEKSEYKKAIIEFTEAIRLDPENKDAYYYRGWCYVNESEDKKAIIDYTEAIRLDPENLDPKNKYAYLTRGFCYKRLKLYKEAEQDFLGALKLKPDFKEAKKALNELRQIMKADSSETIVTTDITIKDNSGTISSGVTPDGSGTVHASGGDIPSGFSPTPSGTAHVGGTDITSGYGTSPVSTAISLNPGDSIVINSITYQYYGVISQSTGEAEIFLLTCNNKRCVFKLYYPNFKPKEDVVKQLKHLKHEDIINVHDYGYYHDRFFEIMDYAEGGTLDKYLPIKDISRVKKIIAETVNAYKFCHSNGVIHKDIKPQNLYYKNADGTDILIGDFGISTLLESGMSRHLTSQSLTVGYAAPEMYGIDGKVYIGKEVDYYALGITIIHIWDGKSPFDGLGIHAISNLTTCGKVHIPEDMPKEVQKLVKGLITVDYTKRWGYDEIQRWLKGEDVPIHFQIKEISYRPYQFGPTESATTTEELAVVISHIPS